MEEWNAPFFPSFLSLLPVKRYPWKYKNDENYNDKCRVINGNQSLLLEFIIIISLLLYTCNINTSGFCQSLSLLKFLIYFEKIRLENTTYNFQSHEVMWLEFYGSQI